MAFDNSARGICKVCGDKAKDGRSFYCLEHMDQSPYQQRKAGAQGVPTNVEPVDEPKSLVDSIHVPNRVKNVPDENDYLGAFGEFLLLVANMLMLAPIGSLPDERQEQLTNELAITDEEMNEVLRPAFRLFSKTTINKKHGKQILEYGDVVGAIPAFISIAQKFGQVRKIAEEEVNAFERQQNPESITHFPTPGGYTQSTGFGGGPQFP